MKRINLALAALLLAIFTPGLALACACGCGIFDVGTGTMLPTDTGGEVWLAYDFMNQTQNWNGSSPSPSSNNFDKVLRTDFFTAGAQYMFNRQWGIEAEIPYWDRTFKTNPTNVPDQGTQVFNHSDIGDVRLKGIYSGFEDDMSTGVTFGLKLASGNFTYPNFDRDSSIGTGSTDLLLGGYHMGDLSGLTGLPFNWFVNGQMDMPFMTQQNYRPGDEFDGAVGSYYNGFDFGDSGKIAPLLQILGSIREHDVGMNASQPIDGMNQSGYQRVFISPGVEYDIDAVRLYGDIEVPVWQHFNGDQLAAPFALKLVVGYSF
jgi:hypothetical protein